MKLATKQDIINDAIVKLNELVDARGADKCVLIIQLIQNLNEKINSLPARCREVFVMSRHEGKTNREISNALGISEKAVEKHITKALKIMDEITR